MITGMPPPAWQLDTWLNTTEPPATLDALHGRIVVLCCFQMLCPGCVAYGLPQARAIAQAYPAHRVQVIGLHMVFQHHAAMTLAALRAFVQEYRLAFPIAVDRADPHGDAMPLTMQAWELEGTPSLVVLDARGRVRLCQLGQISDLRLGTIMGRLLAESEPLAPSAP